MPLAVIRVHFIHLHRNYEGESMKTLNMFYLVIY